MCVGLCECVYAHVVDNLLSKNLIYIMSLPLIHSIRPNQRTDTIAGQTCIHYANIRAYVVLPAPSALSTFMSAPQRPALSPCLS